MKKMLLLLFVTFTGIATVSSQTLDEVLQKYYEANYMDKLIKLESMKYSGKSFQMGMETPFTTTITRSGKFLLEVPIQGQMMKQAYNGEVGWMIAPWTGSLDPIDLDPETVKRIKRQIEIEGPLYNSAEKGYTTELLGKEDLEGTEVYVIKQIDEDKNEYKHYIDAENYILLKTHVVLLIQDSEMEADQYFSNYKIIDGILVATSMESRVNGQVQSQVNIEKAEFNIPIDDKIFDKPVKAATEEENKQ